MPGDQAVETPMEPIKTETVPEKPSQSERPITIKRILEGDIKPPKAEYGQLKELDTRLHALKFSTDVAKKYSGFRQPNATTISFNRYIILKRFYYM